MKNLDNKIQILNENKGEISLYEYVIAESQSDTNFFRFLFDEEFENDFDSSLTVDQKSEFEEWLLELKKEFLLEKWIVVQFPYADHDDSIRVTRRSNFETMNYCDAYGNYGQQVSCFIAGCYTLENSGSTAQSDCSSAINEKFNICVSLEECAGKWTVIPANEDDEFSDELISEIETFIKEWQTNNESHTVVTGWTFHDSHNFKTVVSESDFGEPDCTELDEEEQIEILLQMPETAPHIEGTNTSEESEDFLFHFDRWATNPWFCYVERK